MPRPARPSTLTLNTSHSLYSALKGLWYNAGGASMVDALGVQNLSAAGTAGTASTSFGAVGRCDAADEAFTAATSASHRVTGGCIAWYGVPLGTSSNYAPIAGITYNAAGDSPFVAMAFYMDDAVANDRVCLAHNNGAAAFAFTPSTGTDWSGLFNTDVTLVGNNVSGAQRFWMNGTSIATATVAGDIAYGAGSEVGIGPQATAEAGRNSNIDTMLFLLMDRAMTVDEVAAFDADPWEILRPAPDPPAVTSITIAGLPAGTPGVFTTVSLGTLSSGDGTATHVWTLKDHDGNVVSGASITIVWDVACDVDGDATDVTFVGHVHGWPTASTVTANIAADFVSATNAAGTTGNDSATGETVTLGASVTNPYLESGGTYYFKVKVRVDGVLSPFSNEDAGTFSADSGGGGGGGTVRVFGRGRLRRLRR